MGKVELPIILPAASNVWKVNYTDLLSGGLTMVSPKTTFPIPEK